MLRLATSRKDLDDGHRAATAGAWVGSADQLLRTALILFVCLVAAVSGQEFASACERRSTAAVGEEPIMADEWRRNAERF